MIDDTPDVQADEPDGLVIEPATPVVHIPITSTASLPHQPSWNRYFSAKEPSPVNNETAEILYFRYHIVPWMTADIPGSSFGSSVIALAQDDPQVLATILEFSSYHRQSLDRLASNNGPRTVEAAMINADHYIGNPTVGVCEALRFVRACFDYPPSRWRVCHDSQTPATSDEVTEPLAALLRVVVKFGMLSNLVLVVQSLTVDTQIWQRRYYSTLPHRQARHFTHVQHVPL